MLVLPEEGGDAEVLLFLLGAREAIRWDHLAGRTTLAAHAHLRVATIEFAARAAALLAAAGGADTPLFAPQPAWADPKRHPEPICQLVADLPGPPNPKQLAKASGVSERTLRRWLEGDERPSRDLLDRFVSYLQRRGLAPEPMRVLRYLEWHFALAEITDVIAAATTREFAQELASVFTQFVSCGAKSVEIGLRTIPDGRRLAQAVGALFDVPLEAALAHAEKHGASSAWSADVLAVQRERAALPGFLEIKSIDHVRDLLLRLPRRVPPASQSRRP